LNGRHCPLYFFFNHLSDNWVLLLASFLRKFDQFELLRFERSPIVKSAQWLWQKRWPVVLVGTIAATTVVGRWVFLQVDSYINPQNASERKDVIDMTTRIFAGASVLTGAFFAWQQIYVSREGQYTDRFTKAIDQLGSEKPQIRLGGVYALERIAKDSKKDHWTTIEVLSAFIRENSQVREFHGECQRPVQTASLDVLAALEAISTLLDLRSPEDRINLEEVALCCAELRGVNLSFADLKLADLRSANLSEARLSHAWFLDADLTDTDLNSAILYCADFSGATLVNADLRHANLRHADFSDSDLKNIKFDTSNWASVIGLETAKNVPEALKQQLGLDKTQNQKTSEMTSKSNKD
jgi:hypothetical protein